MPKTVAEINRRIASGEAVVVTAEEMVEVVRKDGPDGAAAKIDVVTTGTFGAMCSSGVLLNLGHTTPRMKMRRVWLNEVEAYAGLAAVDVYLGATQVIDGDPGNAVRPGLFRYGGGHVIGELVKGNEVRLRAEGDGTDCYPLRKFETWVNLKTLNEAVLLNPRNAYQNYNVAVNRSKRAIYTYMGVLRPNFGNANYSSAGELSPLLKDPTCRTIGVGTRVFLGGASGYVAWPGTQHNPNVKRDKSGVPLSGAGTLALVGDLKEMSSEWLVGLSLLGYGVSLAVGVGVPIPVLDADVAAAAGLPDAELTAPVVDYGEDYPAGKTKELARVSYAELKSGSITVKGKTVPTASLSSVPKARKIAETLKAWIEKAEFSLAEPVAPLPGPGEVATGRPLVGRARLEG